MFGKYKTRIYYFPMLSTLKFNIDQIKRDAFVRFFIVKNGGIISIDGWILVDSDNKTISNVDKNRYLNIQYLADATFLNRVFTIERYLIFDSLERSDTLANLCFNEPTEFNFKDVNGKRIYLSPGVGSKTTSISKLTRILTEGGCSVCTNIENLEDLNTMDYCIFNTVAGDEFLYAYDKGLVIGNSYWLMTLLTYGFKDPNKMQIWMPFPHIKSNCANLLISITNIEGTAREYIHKMCKLLGAESTGTLTKNCTHLICGQKQGLKYEKAIKWGDIQLVNALWIEDCFTNWNLMDPALEMYQHISKVIRAEEKLGVTPSNPNILKEAVEMERKRLTRINNKNKSSFITQEETVLKESVIIIEETVEAVEQPVEEPTEDLIESVLDKQVEEPVDDIMAIDEKSVSFEEEEGEKSFIVQDHGRFSPEFASMNGQVKDVETLLKVDEESFNVPILEQRSFIAQAHVQNNLLSDHLDSFMASPAIEIKTPEKPEIRVDPKLKRIPIKQSVEMHHDFVNKLSTPKGTQQFLNKPNSQTPDASLILSKSIVSPEKPTRKRTASVKSSSSNKRQRQSSGSKVFLMFTKGEANAAQSKIMSNLGFVIVKDFKQCTHLVADSVKTTEKFLCAVGKGKQIVTPKWITGVGTKENASEDDYRPKSNIFKDLDLSESRKRALQGPLFSGIKFVLAKSKNLPPLDALTNIITGSGGKVVKMIKTNDIKQTIYVCANENDATPVKEQFHDVTVLTKDALFRCILYQEQ